MSVMSEDAAQRVESGPVVAGFDGSTSGEDALALALWIARINAAARTNGVSYNRLISGLRKAGVTVNRKMLAELAA